MNHKKIIDTAEIIHFGKLPPQAVELEEVVLGALMIDNEAPQKVYDILQPEVFYKDAHKNIYSAIKSLYLQILPVDILTVTQELKKMGLLDVCGGAAYIAELTDKVASSQNIEYHCRIIKEKYIARELIRVATETAGAGYSEETDIFEIIENLQRSIFDLTNFDNISIITMRENLKEYLNTIEAARGKNITGISTGFKELDRHTKGLQPSDLTIIAAETSQGKTSLALNICTNIVLDGVPVFFASYEMSNVQLTGRVLSSLCEIQQPDIIYGHITELENKRYNEAINQLAESKLFLYDIKNNTVGNLINSIRKHKILYDIKIAFIDYLQLISGDKSKNREQEVGEISRLLKNTAKELNISIVALSQLKRERDHTPTLSRLRDSGQIEESADNVIFIYRQEAYLGEDYPVTYKDGTHVEGVAKIIFAKGRNVGTTDFYMRFEKLLTKFSNF